jgi:hypothetical protein
LKEGEAFAKESLLSGNRIIIFSGLTAAFHGEDAYAVVK